MDGLYDCRFQDLMDEKFDEEKERIEHVDFIESRKESKRLNSRINRSN